MFCLIYFSNQPNVLEISQNKEGLLKKMEEKAIQQAMDEVGRNHFVNTLDSKDPLAQIEFKAYPSLGLVRVEQQIEVYKVEKKQVVVKGYLYNSTEEVKETSKIGTYYVVPVEQWKYDDLPKRPEEEKEKTTKPFATQTSPSMIQNYDKVLLELITCIQKRKIE
jgi:hypothetical protein